MNDGIAFSAPTGGAGGRRIERLSPTLWHRVREQVPIGGAESGSRIRWYQERAPGTAADFETWACGYSLRDVRPSTAQQKSGAGAVIHWFLLDSHSLN
jgi:hypothetical protein